MYRAAGSEKLAENVVVRPPNPYAANKLAVDLMLAGECQAFGLAAARLRYFNECGAVGRLGERHDPESHLTPIALQVVGAASWCSTAMTTRHRMAPASATTSTSRTWPLRARGQAPFFAPPKTAAGKRRVILPGTVVAEIKHHLDTHSAPGADALVFTSPRGQMLRHSNFRRATWVPALAANGIEGVHFHDLRHAGNHLVAEAGANLRELMERMGHASSRAALIYLHSSDDRQRTLAEAVSERARRDLTGESGGTYVARDGQSDGPEDRPTSSRDPPELGF